MSDLILFVMLGGAGGLGALVGYRAGEIGTLRRLREAARYAPRDQVALAALERAMRDGPSHR